MLAQHTEVPPIQKLWQNIKQVSVTVLGMAGGWWRAAVSVAGCNLATSHVSDPISACDSVTAH